VRFKQVIPTVLLFMDFSLQTHGICYCALKWKSCDYDFSRMPSKRVE